MEKGYKKAEAEGWKTMDPSSPKGRHEALRPDYRSGTCCVCGHLLANHLKEGDGWRCTERGLDARRCECFLRPILTGTEREKEFYDLGWRMNASEREVYEFKKRFRDSYRRW